MSLDYKKFFEENGHKPFEGYPYPYGEVRDSYTGTVEELYQAFSQRLNAEIVEQINKYPGIFDAQKINIENDLAYWKEQIGNSR